jgi:hypothetical protein
MSPAGRRTDSSHEGNKYGGASPPDSIMLPLGKMVKKSAPAATPQASRAMLRRSACSADRAVWRGSAPDF